MKQKTKKALIGSLVSAAMLATNTAVLPASALTAGAVCIIDSDFNDEIAYPWVPVRSLPSNQSFNMNGGTFNTQININQSNDSVWGLQLRCMGLHIENGHEYKVSFDVNASEEGHLYTGIGDYRGENFVWLNGCEGTAAWNYAGKTDPEGYEHSKYLGDLAIKKGDNHYEGTFIAGQDLEVAQWSFAYGGAGEFCDVPCFPEGTVLKFDNMYLEDLSSDVTCGGMVDYGFDFPTSNVRVNQEGYFKSLSKRASYVTDNKEPLEFEVRDKEGNAVFSGVSKFFGVDPDSGIGAADEKKELDKDSGKYVHILDFSGLKEPGEYTIFVKDNVGVSGTKFRSHEGYFDTDLNKNGELIWQDQFGSFKSYIMNQSPEFVINDNPYGEGIFADALNYFYQNRSGVDIEADRITSGDSSELAHNGTHKLDGAYVQPDWRKYYEDDGSDVDKKYQIDVTGGWYSADAYEKNVPDGAAAAWMLQNVYESGLKNKTAADDALQEARYEIEWLLRMQVQFDDPFWGEYEGMVYNEVRDHKWTHPASIPWDYECEEMPRVVKPPTYAATFDFAAVTAQAARLWKEKDADFAEKCLEASKKAYNAAMSQKEKWHDKIGGLTADKGNKFYAPCDTYLGTGYGYDVNVNDEAYWASCELLITDGDSAYADYIAEYKNPDYRADETTYVFTDHVYDGSSVDSSTASAFDARRVTALGNMSLMLNNDKLDEKQSESLKSSVAAVADKFISYMSEQGMGVPYKSTEYDLYEGLGIFGASYGSGYEYGSNGYVVNNAIMLANAYKATGDKKYLDAAAEALDYIFGRNGLGLSYVTGYGEHSVQNPYHYWWANSIDPYYPKAPSGVLVGGSSYGLNDEPSGLLGMKRDKVAAQRSYVDNAYAFGSNDTNLFWNSALVNILSFFNDVSAEEQIIAEPATTTTITATTTTAAVTTVTEPAEVKAAYGDANCDGKVTLADSLAILQYIANADKYPLSAAGVLNADCVDAGKGITAMDAVAVQMIDTKIIAAEDLPITTEKLNESIKK